MQMFGFATGTKVMDRGGSMIGGWIFIATIYHSSCPPPPQRKGHGLVRAQESSKKQNYISHTETQRRPESSASFPNAFTELSIKNL